MKVLQLVIAYDPVGGVRLYPQPPKGEQKSEERDRKLISLSPKRFEEEIKKLLIRKEG